MGLVSGLISFGRAILSGGARVAAPAARVLRTPAGRAIAGGALTGAAFVGAEQLLTPSTPGAGGTAFGPTGLAPAGQAIAPGSALQQAAASGQFQITPLAGGRFLAIAANGDTQVFSRAGTPIRPQLLIPAGQSLPGGAVVVSTRQNGSLIGIIKRRRRRAFATEIAQVGTVIKGCRAVLDSIKKK